jgi:hypothetical protein
MRRLALEDPAKALRFEELKKQKLEKGLMSSKHAYNRVLVDEISEQILNIGIQNPDFNSHNTLAGIWFRYISIYCDKGFSKSTPNVDYDPMKELEINCLEDLVAEYNHFRGEDDPNVLELRNNQLGKSFTEHLEIKLAEVLELPFAEVIGYEPTFRNPRDIQVVGETPKFFIEQYLRLKKEHQLYKRESTQFFLETMSIYTDYWTERIKMAENRIKNSEPYDLETEIVSKGELHKLYCFALKRRICEMTGFKFPTKRDMEKNAFKTYPHDADESYMNLDMSEYRRCMRDDGARNRRIMSYFADMYKPMYDLGDYLCELAIRNQTYFKIIK